MITDINNLVYPGSFVVFIQSIEIYNFDKILGNENLIVSEISADIWTYLHYVANSQIYQFKAAHYGWTNVEPELLVKFSKLLKVKAVKASEKKKLVKMTMTGIRQSSDDIFIRHMTEVLWIIK